MGLRGNHPSLTFSSFGFCFFLICSYGLKYLKAWVTDSSLYYQIRLIENHIFFPNSLTSLSFLVSPSTTRERERLKLKQFFFSQIFVFPPFPLSFSLLLDPHSPKPKRALFETEGGKRKKKEKNQFWVMDGGASYNPRTVEEVFRDFKGRRAGMIKALTTDVEEFYQQCDPEKENLCLYGFPNEQWEVNLPAEEVPPELPEPALGINFARDGMQEKDWLSLVAVHSDAWLLSVAFYFGARFGFDKADRKRLFNMINDLPTIFEVVTGAAKKQTKEKSSVSNHSSNKFKSNSKRGSESQPKYSKAAASKDEDDDGMEDEDDEEHGDTLCGACGENYASDEFWICCDICEKWFHGKCVKITPARAEHIKQYKCPSCSNKRARP